ncbi:TPA: ABC transporter ATP-binding protein [Bacillus cereus]|jgi:ABC-2 type transport system ATP-binding protein|uniref:ABC transporter ATP-binding protein n=5 Tax=Bacillus cereus group TaxID=86661 RepID=A0A0E1N1J2_BACAN|nr:MULTISPECIES: ABC transporter ATP-binding protein [Bacillus]EDX66798.1 ABC transporter, ATP-binding protein [Bacillus cereus NVH0597-99]EFI65456.1 ABC transporter, ATP-binding protein [Bacillus cereus SJ1]MDR4320209.1 ABC transporter ATP-binding protein [Bacillus paranthracis]CUB52053.1 putative ABC transporter ATP-binding protein YxlF [Bacillus subtilis]ACK88726.1 ABC transporter, ATP-binding protein [Bacillus cereus AH820]
MTTILSVRDVKKVIGKKTIVENISFDVKQGEVFGFLGPNGAGKTTTIRMLVGLIKETEGTISIGGYSIKENFREAMRQIGSIVENPELYTYLTGWENLKQFARMLGGISDERIIEIAHMVHLDERIHDKVKTYSLGMKQRLGIAQALLGNPKLLILDEPTNGLDPAGIRELREFIHKLVKEENMSVFISSHLLSEVQMICDRVAIIHKGKMITVAKVEELIKTASDRVEWIVTPISKAKDMLVDAEEVREVSIEGDRLLCRMHISSISNWNKTFVENGIDVHSVKELVFTLEDLFIELTRGEQHA